MLDPNLDEKDTRTQQQSRENRYELRLWSTGVSMRQSNSEGSVVDVAKEGRGPIKGRMFGAQPPNSLTAFSPRDYHPPRGSHLRLPWVFC
jgi:hypothetical protein